MHEFTCITGLKKTIAKIVPATCLFPKLEAAEQNTGAYGVCLYD